MSHAVQPLGGWGAVVISGGLVVVGLAGGGDQALQTGRDAVEATIFTGIVTNLILKPAAGRVRPNSSDGETTFKPFSSNASFPSGDATEAFAVASVVGARSDGWVVPTLAYTAATLVALERINLNVHFASDVFVGAVFGTVVGHFLVHRHEAEENAIEGSVAFDIDVSAAPGGLAFRFRF